MKDYRPSHGSMLEIQERAAATPIPTDATCDWAMFDVPPPSRPIDRCGAKATERSGLGGQTRWLCKPHKKLELPSTVARTFRR